MTPSPEALGPEALGPQALGAEAPSPETPIVEAPACSVIISAYNAEATIAGAVQSVLAQTLADFELIVVDDASTDRTWDILCAFAARDSRIRPLRNRINRERSWSRNRAIRAARSDLIAILDADDLALPRRLEIQTAFLRANPEVGVVGSAAVILDRGRTTSPVLSDPELRAKLLFVSPLAHVSAMVRKSCLIKAGGYDPEISFAEDYDLWERIAALPGVRLAVLPEALTAYRGYPGGKPGARRGPNLGSVLRRLLHLAGLRRQPRRIDHTLNVQIRALARLGLRPGPRERFLHWLCCSAATPLPEAHFRALNRWLDRIAASVDGELGRCLGEAIRARRPGLEQRAEAFRHLGLPARLYLAWLLPRLYCWRYWLR